MRAQGQLALSACLVAAFLLTGCSRPLPSARMDDKPLTRPLALAPIQDHLAIGSGFSVGVKRDGTVWTWGTDYKGNLARPVRDSSVEARTPAQVQGIDDAVAVSAWRTVLVLSRDGSVRGWGNNKHHQVSPLHVTPTQPAYEQPQHDSVYFTKVEGLPRIVAISQAGEMSVALDESGVVWAWGGGGRNTLFSADGGVPDRRLPTPIHGLPRIVRISASPAVIAGIDEQGRLWTVGYGLESGRAPSVSTKPDKLIGIVPLPTKAVDVDLGGFGMAIVLLENGQVWTWGHNSSGQLGLGHRQASATPVRVESISRIKAIRAFGEYAQALTDDGDLLYWGGLYYEGGIGFHEIARTNIVSPAVLQRGTRAVELAAGGADFAYIDENGSAWYFGRNREGERGTGRAGEKYNRKFVLTPQKSLWSR
jgi:alpha-tubulin suppressor-like RCC1 family protein